jgi:CspA family cold shock protein
MPTGRVKFFNENTGYGFILPDDGGPDVFVHMQAVQRSGLGTLVQGDNVTFEIVANEKTGRSAAANIRLTDELPAIITGNDSRGT